MSTLPIRDLGRGRVTVKNPTQLEPGEARDSLNLLHNHGTYTAKLRAPINRVFATRPANAPVLGLHEYVKASDGSTTKLAKIGTQLYTFTLTPSDALVSILTGLDATHLPQFATANGFVFMADWAVKNYISNGSGAGTNELQKAAPTGLIGLASAGVATGNVAATISYCYTDLDPTTGAESPPATAVTVARLANQGVTVSNTSLTFAAPYTQKNLYRVKAGSAQMYLVTSGMTAGSFPYADTSIDTSLVTASTVHTVSGAAAIEKPEAAKHVVFHRGRIFFANLNGHPSRLRWSIPLTPTQFSNATTARWDVAPDDGGEITGLASFRGSLVIFKTNAIYIMNGDVDERAFTVFPAVIGIGCVAPRSIVVDGELGIYFLGRSGVYRFDLSEASLLSEAILPDMATLDYAGYAHRFCAGLDPFHRLYVLSATPSGQTTNAVTHVLNLMTGAWGRFEFSMNAVTPTCYSPSGENGPMRNATNIVKAFFGDAIGYVYETDVSGGSGADGVITGTSSGLPTVSTATSTAFAAAAWYATGDGLLGLGLTVVRAADKSVETTTITAYALALGVPTFTHAAWVGTAPIVGVDTVYVGAFQGLLSLGRIDFGDPRKKRWLRMLLEWEKQSSTVPLMAGYTLDGDTAPTRSFAAVMSGYRGRISFDGRRAMGLAPYFSIVGTGHGMQLLLVQIEALMMSSSMPADG